MFKNNIMNKTRKTQRSNDTQTYQLIHTRTRKCTNLFISERTNLFVRKPTNVFIYKRANLFICKRANLFISNASTYSDWGDAEPNRRGQLQVASGAADGRLLLQTARSGRRQVGWGCHRRFHVSLSPQKTMNCLF